jgi:ribosomal protein S18 acetylase RimI-like enzyme
MARATVRWFDHVHRKDGLTIIALANVQRDAIVRDAMRSLPTFLDAPRVQAAATILADAMDDDPAYRYLMPNAGTRTAGLRDYFARSLRTYLPHRCTYVSLDGDVNGTVTLRPPGGIDISTLTMIRRGLLPFAVAHGMTSVRRLFTLKDAYDRIEARLSGGRPHWYVHMMAIDPRQQGRGMGGALLADVLSATANAHDTGHPVLLTTHNERNVAFYRKAGFEIVERHDVALDGARPYPVWGMRRS